MSSKNLVMFFIISSLGGSKVNFNILFLAVTLNNRTNTCIHPHFSILHLLLRLISWLGFLSVFQVSYGGSMYSLGCQQAGNCRGSIKGWVTGKLNCNLSAWFVHLEKCFLTQSNLWLWQPLASDHLFSATSFPKYQTFPSQISNFGTSCKQPPLLSHHGHFQS